MTAKEAAERMRELAQKHHELNARIADAARAVVPVLLDAGRTNSAKALQELIFELDACDQEMHQFVRENVPVAIEALMRSLGKDREV